MKILIADDNPEVRSALRLLLEQDTFQATVLEVLDTTSLFKCLKEYCPKVVFLDWELPGLQRDDNYMRLRSRCPKTKVIALSSKFEARQEAMKAGVDAFISKSESPEKILSTLHTLL